MLDKQKYTDFLSKVDRYIENVEKDLRDSGCIVPTHFSFVSWVFHEGTKTYRIFYRDKPLQELGYYKKIRALKRVASLKDKAKVEMKKIKDQFGSLFDHLDDDVQKNKMKAKLGRQNTEAAECMKILRIRDLEAKLGKKKSAIYAHIKAGILPKPIKIGASSGWIESEIDEVLKKLAAKREAVSV